MGRVCLCIVCVSLRPLSASEVTPISSQNPPHSETRFTAHCTSMVQARNALYWWLRGATAEQTCRSWGPMIFLIARNPKLRTLRELLNRSIPSSAFDGRTPPASGSSRGGFVHSPILAEQLSDLLKTQPHGFGIYHSDQHPARHTYHSIADEGPTRRQKLHHRQKC